MKPIVALVSGIGIAGISGTIGYQFGKSAELSESLSEKAPSKSSAAAPRNSERSQRSSVDLSDFGQKLDRIADPLERFSMAIDAMETWVDRHPQAAIDWLTGQPPSGRRNELIRLAISQWAETDPSAAADWTNRNLTGIDLHNALIRIAERWAQSDPASAARWFAALPEGNTRSAPLEGLFFVWANEDPKAAMRFLEWELPGEAFRMTLTQAVLAGWAKTTPTEASSVSLQTSKATNNPALFANTIANWATVDVAASSAWLLENVDSGPERTAAIAEMAGMFAHHDPGSGSQWIKRLEGKERTVAQTVLAEEWSRVNPAAAANWLSSSPVESLSDEAIAFVVNGLLTDSPMEFDAWKEKLPQGKLRDKVVELSKLPETDDE